MILTIDTWPQESREPLPGRRPARALTRHLRLILGCIVVQTLFRYIVVQTRRCSDASAVQARHGRNAVAVVNRRELHETFQAEEQTT
jgi:hypothetical protein